jgi:hypothetical protein
MGELCERRKVRSVLRVLGAFPARFEDGDEVHLHLGALLLRPLAQFLSGLPHDISDLDHERDVSPVNGCVSVFTLPVAHQEAGVATGYIGQFLRSMVLKAQGAIELALEDLKPGVLFW